MTSVLEGTTVQVRVVEIAPVEVTAIKVICLSQFICVLFSMHSTSESIEPCETCIIVGAV